MKSTSSFEICPDSTDPTSTFSAGTSVPVAMTVLTISSAFTGAVTYWLGSSFSPSRGSQLGSILIAWRILSLLVCRSDVVGTAATEPSTRVMTPTAWFAPICQARRLSAIAIARSIADFPVAVLVRRVAVAVAVADVAVAVEVSRVAVAVTVTDIAVAVAVSMAGKRSARRPGSHNRPSGAGAGF